MSTDFQKIASYWRKEYSSKITTSKRYELPAQFKKVVEMTAPGESFYYIANFHTLELEMLSDSVKKFLGLPPEKADMDKLLSLADSDDVDRIHLKEQVAKSFYIDFLNGEDTLAYKLSYTYYLRDYKNKKRLMLHQACPLTVDEMGKFIHVFSIHSDISHLNASTTDDVSFINLEGGESFLNVPIENGVFEPAKLKKECDLQKALSKREKEIVLKFSQGMNSQEIARELHISPNTVQTHRKNILKKTQSKNSVHLVSQCIAAGVINPLN